ncbi:hypothetical protein [Persicitalea jodogahamensis]|uniref:Outer membrane protein beta-barrel domain-containing protein n=1 Tax=Persicitalea jodogahamensis TaxID=402147 RepID=A0A8J3GAD4_9BACT|nr:hypothetical protein [Persicitalea jodogahamensis]GHB69608.1 hypothetical protein GCM10007390_24010 [Persicitalea jodogahamensis]
MKRLLPIVLLCLISGGAMAQLRTFILSNIDHRGFVSLSAGYSLPGCNTPFGKNTEHIMGSGQFAQTSVGYRFGRRLGGVVSYSYGTNTILKDALLNSIGNNVDPADWDSHATNCTLQSVMAGPLLMVPAGRFQFDFQLTAGLAQSTSSHIELNSRGRDEPVSYKTPSQSTHAFAAGAGATARFKLNRWLGIHSSLQYIAANLKYSDLQQEIRLGSQRSVETINASQPLGMMNWGGGISFIF